MRAIAENGRQKKEKQVAKEGGDAEKMNSWDGVPTCPAPVAAPHPTELPDPTKLWKL